jgi:DNA-binding NarL/FixJ family response regulator
MSAAILNKTISVGLVDDHILLRKGLASLISDRGFRISIQADNGKQFIDTVHTSNVPDVLLLDISMPVLDGYATMKWLKDNYPDVKVLALSMYDDEQAIIRMLQHGARGYLLKDCQPEQIMKAIETVHEKGLYHSELVSTRLITSMQRPSDEFNESKLTDRAKRFLQLACSEMTYKEIGAALNLSPRTIDGYRDALFAKLGIKSRVGLVIYAMKHGIVTI